MFKYVTGYGRECGGPVRDLTPGLSDVPDSVWPEPTHDNLKEITDILIEQLPEEVDDPENLSLLKLAGLAIPPTFEDLPEETRALIEEISPGFLEQQL